MASIVNTNCSHYNLTVGKYYKINVSDTLRVTLREKEQIEEKTRELVDINCHGNYCVLTFNPHPFSSTQILWQCQYGTYIEMEENDWERDNQLTPSHTPTTTPDSSPIRRKPTTPRTPLTERV